MKNLLTIAIGAFAFCSSLGYLQAQELVDHSKFVYQGLRNCNMCHGGRGKDNPLNEIVDYQVKLDESLLWAMNDKHILAGKSLDPQNNKLARAMHEVLGEERYAELKKDACVKCHQVGNPPLDVPGAIAPPIAKNEFEHGVSCEACHGPSEKWWPEHNKLSWRKELPDLKLKLGMENFRDPVAKSKLCATCHVGDVKLGRVVTHEMYAAGHPPLPGFEVATFLAAMPAHWQVKYPESEKAPSADLKERFPKKPEAYREHIGLQNIYAVETRELLFGALVSYEAYLTLLADTAKAEAPAAKGNVWPELAYYDCYACHHSLSRGSASNPLAVERISSRQQRGFQRNVPGRPPLQSWQATLAKIALQHTDVKLSLELVNKELNTVPFGEQAKLAEALSNPTKQLRDAAARLNSDLSSNTRKNIPPAQALQADRLLTANVLHALIELGASELQEYDAARQLVWAIDRVRQDSLRLQVLELTPAHGMILGKGPSELSPQHKAFAQFFDEDPNASQKMFQIWKFDLPKRAVEQKLDAQPIADNTSAWLQARVNYQPAVLRQKFQELRAALAAAKPVAE